MNIRPSVEVVMIFISVMLQSSMDLGDFTISNCVGNEDATFK